MSNIYNLAPPTKGKVLLKTSIGDIDVELWAKEAPKASRNFVQLCMEGYYDGTIFHRIIKDFMVQGGDPTGTGKGGESIYGEPFKDEFHSRLRFVHRGIVACANENALHTNGSQFFITQEACQHLDKKHTIFGKVVGDSIYNVAHFNQLETNEDDRPLEPPKVLSAEILWNPFDDIIPRTTPEEREAEAALLREQEATLQRLEKGKRKRNLGLLSFREEAEEDDEELEGVKNVKLKSVFDTYEHDGRSEKGTEHAEKLEEEEEKEEQERKRLKASVRSMLSKDKANDAADTLEGNDVRSTNDIGSNLSFDERMRARVQQQRDKHKGPSSKLPQAENKDEREEDGQEEQNQKKRPARDRQREAMESGSISHAKLQASKLVAKQDTNLMSDLQRRQFEAKERSKLAKQNGGAMAKLLSFRKQLAKGKGNTVLSTAVQSSNPPVIQPVIEAEEDGDLDQQLPGAWRTDNFLEKYTDESFSSLASHRLEFLKEKDKKDAMARNHDDDYVVQDPLLAKNQKWNAKDGAERRRNREWAADVEGPLD